MQARAELERRRRRRERHNTTWSQIARVCTDGELDELCAELRREWEDLKSDPLREVVAVWLGRVLRTMYGADFRQEVPDVAQWLYNGGTPRVDLSVWHGFDQLVTELGFPGIYDWGRVHTYHPPSPIDFRAEAEEDARYAACVRWAEHHAGSS